MKITKPMTDAFISRTKKHISLVNYFADKLGVSFPYHDIDKFGSDLIDGYTIFNWCLCHNEPIPEEDKELINICTANHIKHNPHHPEYWVNNLTDEGNYDRFKPPKGLIIPHMDKEAIVEMCCDWCAVSKEKHEDPFNWCDKTIGTRWIFPTQVEKDIYSLINVLWIGEQ